MIYVASKMLKSTGWNLAGKCGYVWEVLPLFAGWGRTSSFLSSSIALTVRSTFCSVVRFLPGSLTRRFLMLKITSRACRSVKKELSITTVQCKRLETSFFSACTTDEASLNSFLSCPMVMLSHARLPFVMVDFQRLISHFARIRNHPYSITELTALLPSAADKVNIKLAVLVISSPDHDTVILV